MTLFRPLPPRTASPAESARSASTPQDSAQSTSLPALEDTAGAVTSRISKPQLAELRQCILEAVAGRFEVGDAFAIGGMAVLFPLRHVRTGGLHAAKLMRPELARDPALRTLFLREARLGARLASHPNAVPVLDLENAGDLPYLLMPFIEGEDLDQVLARRGALGREEALMLLAQMASLLMFAERERIVHADIAVGNLRLDRFGQYRLLDFGLAHSLDDVNATLPATGTPATNSPEQLLGLRLDVRSDLYSLGLVFLHALTGRPALPTADLEELRRAHLEGHWQMPPEVEADPALRALVQSLLATDREQRMPSAFALAGALAALGYELPVTLRLLDQGDPAPPRLRRRRLELTPAKAGV